MSEPHFGLDLLQNIEPWQWPQEAAKTILDALSDRQTKASERLIAADMAGDMVVMNEDIAEALIGVVGDATEPVDLRAQAAISFGPVLEQTDVDGFDEWLVGEDGPPISQETFDKIRELLQQVHFDPSAPKEVRRRALEAAVRAPEEWHRNAIKKAYASGDREWMLTAVFGMRYVKGFNGPILEALNSKDEEIHFEAINAAGDRQLDPAWPHVKALIQNAKTPNTLLLAAIEAVSTIRPGEARDVLDHLTDSEDEEIAEAAEEAIGMAEAMLAGENPDDEDERF